MKVVLFSHELESTDKMFVRYNEQYLYYGTHSETTLDGNKIWVIHGYGFGERRLFP